MDLETYGFVEAGKWRLKGGLKSGIAFELDRLENERVIYAFIAEDDTKYIGVCSNTNTTLSKRMERYKGWQGTGTNKRIAEKIRKLLEKGQTVKILALNPPSFPFRGLDIDLVKGLENPLIARLKPEWNIQK